MKNLFAMVAFLAVIFTGTSNAHEIRPGYLEVNEQEDGTYGIVWKAPLKLGRPMAIAPVFPDDCSREGVVDRQATQRAVVTQLSLSCTERLSGRSVALAGLALTSTDVLVRVQPLEGSVETYRATPSAPAVTISADETSYGIAGAYFGLGVEHILQGIDHLLFVAALVLLISGVRRLIETITAFTIAHSLTLIATSLGWLALPIAPVEAVIALSIVFLASELVNKQAGQLRLSEQRPWMVAFIFGLLHGFGFAGALAEIGLPDRDVAVALLTFNLGVEAGQLMFVAALIAALKAAGFFVSRRPIELTAAYAIGIAATFWLFQRVSGMI